MVKIRVPYFSQKKGYTCGPASLEMVLKFFGVSVVQDRLEKVEKTKKDGTSHGGLIDAARKYGFYCFVDKNSSISMIKHFVGVGLPVIVNYIEPSDDEGHYSVVVGYNEKKVIMNDPWNGKNFEMSWSDFESRWHGQKPKSPKWLMVLSKKEFDLGRQYSPTKK